MHNESQAQSATTWLGPPHCVLRPVLAALCAKTNVSNILDHHKSELIDRVKEQIGLERERDVSALYEFTLPEIREKRISERSDEPGLTKDAISSFVQKVESAEVQSIEILEYHEEAPLYSNCPAATVLSLVTYNGQLVASKSRTVWVLSDGVWYSTALNRSWF